MRLVNTNGEYLQDYIITSGDIFSIIKPTINIMTTTNCLKAIVFPKTNFVFDILELLGNDWRCEYES